MEHATIYPYSSSLLPIVRNFHELQNEYVLDHIISHPGSGLTGKAAAYVCNQPNISIDVEETLDLQAPWTTLFVDVSRLTDRESANKLLADANASHKKVFLIEDTSGHIPSWHRDIQSRLSKNEFPARLCKEEIDQIQSEMMHEITTPIFLVGGLVEQADTLDVVCSITKILRQKGLRVEVVTSKPACRLLGFHDMSYLFDRTKVLEDIIQSINKFIYAVQNKFLPDVILVLAPDGMIQYNSLVPNGFGIKTYMTCQAVCPDYCYCCVPADMSSPEMIESLSTDFMYRYGVAINAAHISNLVVDTMQILQDRKLSFSYLEMESVNKYLSLSANSKIPVFNVFTQKEKVESALESMLSY